MKPPNTPPPEAADQPPDHDERSAPRVLLVEDEPDVAYLVRRALEQAVGDDTVLWAQGGKNALEHLGLTQSASSAQRPELVLLDLRMPGMDGHQVLDRLRANPETRSLPVVILSSSMDENDLRQAFEAGADGYVHKPVDHDELQEAMHAIAEHVLDADHDR